MRILLVLEELLSDDPMVELAHRRGWNYRACNTVGRATETWVEWQPDVVVLGPRVKDGHWLSILSRRCFLPTARVVLRLHSVAALPAHLRLQHDDVCLCVSEATDVVQRAVEAPPSRPAPGIERSPAVAAVRSPVRTHTRVQRTRVHRTRYPHPRAEYLR